MKLGIGRFNCSVILDSNGTLVDGGEIHASHQIGLRSLEFFCLCHCFYRMETASDLLEEMDVLVRVMYF